jgi:hypothetical protein
MLPVFEFFLDLHSDGPDKSEELAADSRGHLLPELPFGGKTPVAGTQSVLRFPGDFLMNTLSLTGMV